MAKPRLVKVRRPSKDALQLAAELLATARADLRAARLLHSNQLNAQAVFSLQQAVEKTGKAYGLAAGLAEPKELLRDWSHNSLRLSELMADYRAQQTALNATGSAVTGTPPVPVTANGPKAFMQLFEDPKALREPFLGEMVTMCRACIRDYEAYKADAERANAREQEMAASIAEGRTDEAEIRKARAVGVYLARVFTECAVLLPAHMLLGMATLPHAVRARYPDPTVASDAYTVANPVVRRFDELCEICGPFIGSVANYVALAGTLGEIMAMPSVEVIEEVKSGS